MKKYWLGAAALLLLTGCGKDDTTVAADTTTAATTTQTETTAPETTTAEDTTTTAPETTAVETTTAQATTTTAAATTAATTTTTTTTTAAATTAETTTAPGSGAWRTAYADILKSTSAKKFSLCYVDDNDIPELVLHETGDDIHANADVTLYTFDSGKVIKLGENIGFDGYSQFCYVPRKDWVIEGFFNMGCGTYSFRVIQDGEYHDYYTCSCDTNDNTYIVNGEEYSEGSVIDKGDFDVTEENILKHLS